ncbi:type II secretion system protein [Candidatus Daviesbacteria bacterium]|nr:type II secretion system protein [Candidatus Daviesbacteria bacterium]
MKRNGFTIAEILVVIAVMAVVGTFLVAIFSSTLRGNNKSQILSAIKQNGQAVLDRIDKEIRGADDITCRSSDGYTLVILKSKIYTRFRFIPPASTSNGIIAMDNPVQSTEDQQLFLNNVCTDPLVNPVALTDSNLRSGVSVENGSFIRDKPAGLKDQITIKFDLKAAKEVPPVIADDVGAVTFQTTVSCRNCP